MTKEEFKEIIKDSPTEKRRLEIVSVINTLSKNISNEIRNDENLNEKKTIDLLEVRVLTIKHYLEELEDLDKQENEK